MNLYFRLTWTWLRARMKPAVTMGHTLTMRQASPTFPSTVGPWIEAERLIRS